MKPILPTIITMILIIPAFADITPDTINPSCDSTTLSGATDGSVNLRADWTPHNITLEWYNDNTKYSQNTCEYSGNITLPTNKPTKTGYTFAGWRIRENSTQCNLSMYYTNDTVDWDDDHVRWKPINGNQGYTMTSDSGWTDTSGDLNNGEWGVTFPNGELRGHAVCTNIAPNNLNNLINADAQTLISALYGDNSSGIIPYTTFNKNDNTGGYCWCAGTSFINQNNTCSVTPSSWVFGVTNSASMSMSKDECISECSSICVIDLAGFNIIEYRQAIFGIPQ